MSLRGQRFIPATTIANDGVTVVFNTTWGLAKVASSTTLGDKRGRYNGYRLLIDHIKVGNQAVTISFKKYVDGAWVADLDAPLPDGTSLTASTTYQSMNWYLEGGERQCYITNGGTGPDDLDVECMLTSNPNPGV